MMNSNVKPRTILTAMRAAATRGLDPYNSHETQAVMLQYYWRMDAGREAYRAAEQDRHRSEAWANQAMAHGEWALLRRQAE